MTLFDWLVVAGFVLLLGIAVHLWRKASRRRTAFDKIGYALLGTAWCLAFTIALASGDAFYAGRVIGTAIMLSPVFMIGWSLLSRFVCSSDTRS